MSLQCSLLHGAYNELFIELDKQVLFFGGIKDLNLFSHMIALWLIDYYGYDRLWLIICPNCVWFIF